MIGFPSPGRQEIAILFDPNVVTAAHDPGGNAGTVKNPRFDEAFQADSDGDNIKELYKHYRPPLEAKITRLDGGADSPTKVWNPYQLPEAEPLKSQLLDASDHFPVTFDFQ